MTSHADGADRLLLGQNTGILDPTPCRRNEEVQNASSERRFELVLEPAIRFGETRVTQKNLSQWQRRWCLVRSPCEENLFPLVRADISFD